MSTIAPGVSTAAVATAAAGADSDRPPDVVAGDQVASGGVRHVSVPQLDTRQRRQEMMSRPSAKELISYQQQQRQQHGRSSNSGSTSTAVDRGQSRRSPVVHGVVGSNGAGGFKNKLRNSFRSAAKRVRQQQTAIDALAKNSQMLALHSLQHEGCSSPTTAQRIGRVSILHHVSCAIRLTTFE